MVDTVFELNVLPKEKDRMIDEVVIVGYGTQRRRELVGTVSTVPKTVIDHHALTLNRMPAGSVAGVGVTKGSGQTGETTDIRVRV
jgi:nanoRNase/pAp phosphatase (c-di-AMP/oligoRNAs hydrolase)